MPGPTPPDPDPSNHGATRVPESFERLVEEYYRPAYRFAFSLSGNHSDASACIFDGAAAAL